MAGGERVLDRAAGEIIPANAPSAAVIPVLVTGIHVSAEGEGQSFGE
jgi:hypothetical protein